MYWGLDSSWKNFEKTENYFSSVLPRKTTQRIKIERMKNSCKSEIFNEMRAFKDMKWCGMFNMKGDIFFEGL